MIGKFFRAADRGEIDYSGGDNWGWFEATHLVSTVPIGHFAAGLECDKVAFYPETAILTVWLRGSLRFDKDSYEISRSTNCYNLESNPNVLPDMTIVLAPAVESIQYKGDK